jgi:hypothetical protein
MVAGILAYIAVVSYGEYMEESSISRSSPLRRLIVGNALEWNQQSERRDLPGNRLPELGQPRPDDDMALFWSGDDKVVITPNPVDALHVGDCCAVLNYRNVACFAPSSVSDNRSICEAITTNERSFGEVADYIDNFNDGGRMLIEGYGATAEYANLVAALRSRLRGGLDDSMTERENLEIISCLDSKIRVREFFAAALLRAARQVRLTRAFTARPGANLLEYVRGASLALGPVMVKAEYGFGGHGMVSVEDIESISDQISDLTSMQSYSDLLIEEYIGSGDSVVPICFTGVVGPAGEVTNSSVGCELQYSIRYYAGAIIGNESLPPEFAASARQAGEAVGTIMSYFGYRGSFTLDLLGRKDDAAAFLLEVNPRRALPSTLGDICLQLFGPGYETKISAMARRWVPVHSSIADYPRLREFLAARGLFGTQRENLVILPYSISLLHADSAIGLAVAGPGRALVENTMEEAMQYLAEGNKT